MKKGYLQLLFSVFLLLATTGTFAQTAFYNRGDIAALITPTMTHDSNACNSTCFVTANITINSSFLNDSVIIVDTITHNRLFAAGNATGASPWSVIAGINMYNTVQPDYMVSSGIVFFNGPVLKIISGVDTIDSIPNNYVLPVPNPCTYSNVTGTVFVDNNGDCAYNAGDVPLNGLIVTGTENLFSPSTGRYMNNVYTMPTGIYTMRMQQSWMTNYTVSLPPSYAFIFPVTSCFTGSITSTTLPLANADFPLQCSSNIDLQCWANAPCDIRPLGAFLLHPYATNTGCDSATGILTLVKDSHTTYNASLSTNPATYVSGDTLQWNYTNLTNISNGAYWNSFIAGVHLTPDATVNIGDTLCFHGYATIASNDIDSTNNVFNICIPVVASYDPNIKEVSPRGTGVTGDIPVTTPDLEYTIHFQNTGTALAYNVNVVDTLDGDVDALSLKILGASHYMVPEWLAPGVVRFNFNSIFLPDSNANEPASYGFVRFKVNMHTGLALGTQIKNKGYIYFDSNPAVITNEALNTIADPTVAITNVIQSGNLRIYPNPATSQVTVENLQNGTLSIMGINGNVVMTKEITTAKTTIDISHLPAGMYIIKTTDKNSTSTTKLIKQ